MSEQKYQTISDKKEGLFRTINQFKKESKPVSNQIMKNYEKASKTLEVLKHSRDRVKVKAKDRKAKEIKSKIKIKIKRLLGDLGNVDLGLNEEAYSEWGEIEGSAKP